MNLNFVVYSLRAYDDDGNVVATIDRISTIERQYRIALIPLSGKKEAYTIFGSLNSVKKFVEEKLGGQPR